MGNGRVPSQREKFKRAARESGADESEDHFKARLRKIAKAQRPMRVAPPKYPKDEHDKEAD